MKRILLGVLSIMLFASVSFAYSAKDVKKQLEYFKSVVYSTQYYDSNNIFQNMDDLRNTYMNLRKESPEEAIQVAPLLNEPIQIANGNRTITLVKYINMESCMLWHTEQDTFEEFQKALEEDLVVADRVPNQFMVGVETFRHALEKMNENSKMDFVLQNAMTVMDAYNELKESEPQAKGAMAREFCKPVKTGLGDTVNPAEFILENIDEVNWFNGFNGDGVVSQLRRFAQEMRDNFSK